MKCDARGSRPKAPKSSPSAGTEGGESDDNLPGARKYLMTSLVRWRRMRGSDGSYLEPVDQIRVVARAIATTSAGSTTRAGVSTAPDSGRRALRDVVIAKLRARLFPAPDDPDSVPTWLSRLSAEVRDEIDARAKGQGDPRPCLTAELGQIDGQVRGWSLSLGNPNLAQTIRSALEGLLEPALERRRQVERQLAELEATRSQLDEILDESVVLDRLRRLEVVLANGNVAEGNRELRRVIDRVVCYADGRVELRTVRLGLSRSATAWLNPTTKINPTGNDGSRYWTDPVDYVKPPRLDYRTWVRYHAAEVLAKRQETGWNVRQLSDHFGKCRETIDKALALAARNGPGDNRELKVQGSRNR